MILARPWIGQANWTLVDAAKEDWNDVEIAIGSPSI
jgi:hypothetical protein